VDGYGSAGEVVQVPDAGEAGKAVAAVLRPGDVVLVKASRSVALERVIESLRGEASGVDAGKPR
jgi:UDP-N-acetylmuramyl pentapeptide synthase